MADTEHLKCSAEKLTGSSPVSGTRLSRTSRPPRVMIGCFDCRKAHSNYMVKECIWNLAFPDYCKARIIHSDIFIDLCFECLQRRLGRDLTMDDFTSAPVNDGIRLGYIIKKRENIPMNISELLSSLTIGQVVNLHYPLRPGKAELVHIIKAGERPDPNNINLWYGPNIPNWAYGPAKVDRYIFSRGEGVNGFVIIPSLICSRLISLD
jgi:hypothetical protein